MKTITYSIFSILLFSILAVPSFGQEKAKKTETIEFEVAGVCGMCKTRIENAALIKGVKMAEWDKDTQMLKVVYATKKTTPEDIHRSLAKAGHRTDQMAADETNYKNLPGCCQYDDGVEVH